MRHLILKKPISALVFMTLFFSSTVNAAAFEGSDSGSLWLTSFVVRVFGQEEQPATPSEAQGLSQDEEISLNPWMK